MNNPYNFSPILEVLEKSKVEDLNLDVENFKAEYSLKQHDQPFIIKFISILGGILASLSFFVFVYLFDLLDSSIHLLSIGVFAIILTIWLNYKSEKIVLSSFSVSCYIIGFYFLNTGLNTIGLPYNSSQIIIMVICLVVLIYSQGFLLTFLSAIFFNLSFQLFYEYFYSGPGNIHLGENATRIHFIIYTFHYIILLALILFTYGKEAKLLSYNTFSNRILYPIRLAMVVFYIFLLYNYKERPLLGEGFPFQILLSILQWGAILYITNNIIEEFKFFTGTKKWLLIVLLGLGLACSVYAPGITGGILLMLLGYKYSDKTTLIMSIVVFLFFLGKYYYDLDLTLLVKSIMLFCSGILFFIIQHFLTPKKIENEKI